jgi:predicted HNH restriction endonuclease
MKICVCGETDQDKFYKSQRNNYCKQCWNNKAREKQRKARRQIVAYLGGKCQLCGYNAFIEALEVHHLDPALKDRSGGNMGFKSWKRIERELQTCILLCANCHAAVEAGHLTPLV